MRWYTSDLHLNHENVLGYTRRPYDDLNAMAEGLAERWNLCVKADDEVWILGDLTLRNPCPDGVPEQWLAGYLKELAGHKHLVLGNHDRGWRQGTVKPGWEKHYLALGFEEVVVNARDTLGRTPVWLHHLPADPGDPELVRDVVTKEVWDRAVPERADAKAWRLNGHVHAAWRQRGRQVNVGVDAWAGWPVSEEEIGLLVAAGPADREVLTWQRHAGMGW